MRYLKYGLMLGLLVFAAGIGTAHAQVAVRVGPVGVAVPGPAYVGPPPNCAYGYYGYYPYACAPYGYYGPNYFAGGVFIGAGPWFHGFYGHPYWGRGPGFYGRGWVGRPGFRGLAEFHGGPAFHGDGGFRSFHGGGGFRGGAVRGGGGFHGGAGFHGGGHR